VPNNYAVIILNTTYEDATTISNEFAALGYNCLICTVEKLGGLDQSELN
jgi:hypothetical protein